ncbi:hypothetical protein ElyMa_000980900 [Elysia marginata]|uniref:Uncharacterized protein n=1 Tax=Elysia marginata TaxID=1093978 RepID=A0AAV4HJG6_9GAST|nr:hypothetical protein ElyMa_000980900 [Elysia marginata]
MASATLLPPAARFTTFHSKIYVPSASISSVPKPMTPKTAHRCGHVRSNLDRQDPHPAAHGSHLTANKVPNSREKRRFGGIEESDRTTEARQEDGQKTKQEGKCLSLAAFYCITRDKHTVGIILCSPPNEGPVPTRELGFEKRAVAL